MAKQWGGKRVGAGRTSAWKTGSTALIRVPVSLVDEVMRYAHRLDDGGVPFDFESAPPPLPSKQEKWEQLSKVLDEKQRLTLAYRQVKGELEKVQKQAQRQDSRLERMWRMVKEARAQLQYALKDHRARTGRVGVKILESVILALSMEDPPQIVKEGTD